MDYYSILNVSITSTDEEIRNAYLTLAKLCHPDHVPDKSGEKWRLANDRFANITLAYRTLIDKDRRREYDRKLRGGIDRGTQMHIRKLFQDARNSVNQMDFQKAEAIMDGILKLSKTPEYVAYMDMIKINLSKDIDQSLIELQRIVDQKMFEGFFHAVYARALLALGRMEEATKFAQDALKWDPDCEEAIDVNKQIDKFMGSDSAGLFSKFKSMFKK